VSIVSQRLRQARLRPKPGRCSFSTLGAVKAPLRFAPAPLTGFEVRWTTSGVAGILEEVAD